MKRTPYPWQDAAVKKFAEQDSAAFFMDMRLGKSWAAIRWMRDRATVRGGSPRFLVLTASTPAPGWVDELHACGEEVDWAHGPLKKREQLIGRVPWTIMTYGSFRETPRAWAWPWDGVLLDESTIIKSPKAQITKLVHHVLNPRIRGILTGLPSPQREDECYMQMLWCYGGEWQRHRSYWTWRKEWMCQRGLGWELRLNKLGALREDLRRDAFILTRKEAGVGPEKLRSRRQMELDAPTKKASREAEATWEIPGVETKNRLEVLTWVHRMAGGHLPGKVLPCWKYSYLVDMLKTELADQQVVVWFAFSAELARAWKELKHAGLVATYIQGSVDAPERGRRRALFQDGSRRIMLATAACARFGLDLSAASTAIYFSNSRSYETRRQSEDRIVTVQKTEPLQIVDLASLDSIDEDVLGALAQKKSSADFLMKAVLKRTKCR